MATGAGQDADGGGAPPLGPVQRALQCWKDKDYFK